MTGLYRKVATRLRDERRYEASDDEILAFPSLRRATFRTGRGADALKVWAHRITPEGNPEGLTGLLQVRQGDEIRQFNLKLYGGQVVLPMMGEGCEVNITFAGTDGAGPLDRLL